LTLPATTEELERIKNECIAMVNKRAAVSGFLSAVPIPGIDLATDVGILHDLIKKINHKFGLEPEQIEQLDEVTKQIVFNVAKQTGKTFIEKQIRKAGRKAGTAISKKLVASVLKRQAGKQTTRMASKFIPVVGQIAAAGIGFTAMKMAGHNHINDCYVVVKKVLQKKKEIAPS
jgi:uncharacterized protein (DUF697 family)